MRTRLTAAALTAAALLALTACSSGDGDGDAGGTAAPSATGTVGSAPAADSPGASTSAAADKAVPGIPAKPTGPRRAAYLAALKAVDPAIVRDPDGAVADGRNQCTSLNGGARNPDHSAAERFGDDTHPLTDTQGKAINLALRATLCPKG